MFGHSITPPDSPLVVGRISVVVIKRALTKRYAGLFLCGRIGAWNKM